MASAVVTTAVVVAALVVGLLANRFVRPRWRGDDQDAGYTLNELLNPLETLAVLLLAFVLVVAAQSYDDAESAVQTEAASSAKPWHTDGTPPGTTSHATTPRTNGSAAPATIPGTPSAASEILDSAAQVRWPRVGRN